MQWWILRHIKLDYTKTKTKWWIWWRMGGREDEWMHCERPLCPTTPFSISTSTSCVRYSCNECINHKPIIMIIAIMMNNLMKALMIYYEKHESCDDLSVSIDQFIKFCKSESRTWCTHYKTTDYLTFQIQYLLEYFHFPTSLKAKFDSFQK